MTPDQLRTALLYSPRTEEMYASLPEDALFLVVGKPVINSFAKANEQAKSGRVLRRWALAAAFVWLFPFFRHHNATTANLLLIICAYEFAYGNAAKVRADLADMQDQARQIDSVDEYLRKKFPGYMPPTGEFTIFSVLP